MSQEVFVAFDKDNKFWGMSSTEESLKSSIFKMKIDMALIQLPVSTADFWKHYDNSELKIKKMKLTDIETKE